MAVYPGLSALTVGVDDLRAATRFYERLGWPRSKEASSAATSLFALNNGVLALFDRTLLAEAFRLPAQAGTGPLVLLTQNHRSASAVDAAAYAMARAGGRLLSAPGPAGSGAWRALVTDRAGLVFDLVHDPHVEVGPDGSLMLPP